jgi:hypothetical protein
VIRKVSFTGSVAVGKHLIKLAADGAKRTTMELGGHSPVLIFDDANLDKALDLLVAHKFRNSGQVCVSPTRFYVQESVYEQFSWQFAQRAATLAVGDGMDAASPFTMVTWEGSTPDAPEIGCTSTDVISKHWLQRRKHAPAQPRMPQRPENSNAAHQWSTPSLRDQLSDWLIQNRSVQLSC